MDVQAQLDEIEADLRAGRYRGGPWARLLTALRMQPESTRRACSAQVTRISDELHRGAYSHRISLAAGLTIEVAATIAGAALLAHAISVSSPVEAIVVAVIWMVTLQPLVKVAVGAALGVRYSYAYLYGVEPRFKMRYGSYLALPRALRILLHMSGLLGSPIGTALVWVAVRGTMPVTGTICAVAFWFMLILNLAILGAGLAGMRMLPGRVPVRLSSGGVAAQEVREALRW